MPSEYTADELKAYRAFNNEYADYSLRERITRLKHIICDFYRSEICSTASVNEIREECKNWDSITLYPYFTNPIYKKYFAKDLLKVLKVNSNPDEIKPVKIFKMVKK